MGKLMRYSNVRKESFLYIVCHILKISSEEYLSSGHVPYPCPKSMSTEKAKLTLNHWQSSIFVECLRQNCNTTPWSSDSGVFPSRETTSERFIQHLEKPDRRLGHEKRVSFILLERLHLELQHHTSRWRRWDRSIEHILQSWGGERGFLSYPPNIHT